MSHPSNVRSRRSPEFIEKLYNALETARVNHDPDLRWVAPGQFEIAADQSRALNVLARHQLHFNMFSSFVRQLSYYDFKRLSDRRRSETKGMLHAPRATHIHFGHTSQEFYSGNKNAISSIARKCRKREKKKKASPKVVTQVETQPTHYFASAQAATRTNSSHLPVFPTFIDDSDRRYSRGSSHSLTHSHSESGTSSDEEHRSPLTYRVTIPSGVVSSGTPPAQQQSMSAFTFKPSFIQIDDSGRHSAGYPTPLTSPYYTSNNLTTASSTEYLSPGSSGCDVVQNPFARVFGAATGLNHSSTYDSPQLPLPPMPSNSTLPTYRPFNHEVPAPYVAIETTPRWNYPGSIQSQRYPSSYDDNEVNDASTHAYSPRSYVQKPTADYHYTPYPTSSLVAFDDHTG